MSDESKTQDSKAPSNPPARREKSPAKDFLAELEGHVDSRIVKAFRELEARVRELE